MGIGLVPYPRILHRQYLQQKHGRPMPAPRLACQTEGVSRSRNEWTGTRTPKPPASIGATTTSARAKSSGSGFETRIILIMGRVEKTIFISYRRADLGWAQFIDGELRRRGYDVFLDFLVVVHSNCTTTNIRQSHCICNASRGRGGDRSGKGRQPGLLEAGRPSGLRYGPYVDMH
jgi:hypothetical protein